MEALAQRRCSVLIDGSLRNKKYYGALFERIRREHPEGLFRIALLHVTCSPPSEVLRRAEQRAKTTGRAVPTKV